MKTFFLKISGSVLIIILLLFTSCENQNREGNSGTVEHDTATERGRAEELEDILHEGVETQEMDRGVRGEGTSLDGPDLNRTGTRTGTEIDKRQKNIEEDMEREDIPTAP